MVYAQMENQDEYFVPINTVAKQLGVPAHTLRYWEKQFATAIRPVTGAGNRRYYRRETIEKIRMIKSLLYDRGMTILGVKKMLHNGDFGNEIRVNKNTPEIVPDTSTTKKSEIANHKIDTPQIDMAIDLLKRAKMFLE